MTTTFPRRDADDQPRFVLDLCKSLVGDYEQCVLAPSGPGFQDDDRIEGIRVKRFRYFLNRGETLAYGTGILGNLKAVPIRWFLVPFFLFGLIVALCRNLRRFDPDIVHAHWWLPAGLAARIAIVMTRSDCRLLITCHGADYFVLGERFAGLRRWVFDRADAVAMVSPAMRNHAISRGLPEDKLCVAPMGANIEQHFRPGAVAQRRGVLYVGRLVEKKGVDDLLAAWAVVSESVRAQGLTIIGSGIQQEALLSLAKSLGVNDSVHFLGAIAHEDLLTHYQHAALLVFPSVISPDNDQEGLGLVAIEAMACGCPVLASDVPSLTDVILDGQTGFVFPMRDAGALASRLDELMASPEIRRAVAQRGCSFVTSRFGWTAVGDRYRSLYEDLLRRDGSNRNICR